MREAITPEQRQQSLAAARRACEWLAEYRISEDVACLIAEFTRLDEGEQQAVEAEREACAKILDEFSEAHDPHTPIGGTFIRAYATGAQAIRARGEKGEG